MHPPFAGQIASPGYLTLLPETFIYTLQKTYLVDARLNELF
jgi:hypothetical protein